MATGLWEIASEALCHFPERVLDGKPIPWDFFF